MLGWTVEGGETCTANSTIIILVGEEKRTVPHAWCAYTAQWSVVGIVNNHFYLSACKTVYAGRNAQFGTFRMLMASYSLDPRPFFVSEEKVAWYTLFVHFTIFCVNQFTL